MTYRWAWFLIAPVVLALGFAGVLFARREGTATGTPPDLSTPVRKPCPSGPPDGCRDFIARELHVEVQTLPSIAATIEGLQFRGGYVLISRTGDAPPSAHFEYAASSQDSEFHTFVLHIASRTSSERDNRRVGRTPGGRPVR